MTRSTTRSTIRSRRRMAGVATAALLSLGLLTACGSDSSDTDASSASSSQKAESHAKSPDSSDSSDSSDKDAKGRSNLSTRAEGGEPNLLAGDPNTTHRFQFSVDGGTEAIAEVSALSVDQPTEQVLPSNKYIPRQQNPGTVTVLRGAEQSQQFTDLINGATQPQTASLSMLDTAGAVTKQYTLQEPKVIKVDNPQGGGAQSVTIQFTNLTVG